MKRDKLKMSNKRFLAIMVPVMVLLLAIILGISITMSYYGKVMDFALGKGELVVTPAKGTEDWDGDYYNRDALTDEQVTENALKIAEEVANEGIVLLKNKDNALPLRTDENTVSLFGWSAYHPVYGGYGSNKLDEVDFITPMQGLENAGYSVDEELADTYAVWSKNTKRYGLVSDSDATNINTVTTCDTRPFYHFGICDWDIIEMPLSTQLASSSAEKSDIAVVVLGRQSGEQGDMPMSMGAAAFHGRTAGKDGNIYNSFGYNPDKHYLQLSDEEEAMIETIKAANFEKIIVVLNSVSIMQTDDLENDPEIDAVLYVSTPGEVGFNSLGNVLNGTVNPSARLVDTVAYNFLNNPTSVNFGDANYYDYKGYFNGERQNSRYSNVSSENTIFDDAYFSMYEEGIYMGYRYYETAAIIEDGFNYDEEVLYPFGYGLSYTTFEQEILDYSISDGKITVNVRVKNTGDVPGKDVVQVYYSAPYGDETSNPYKYEKAAVVLGNYGKTKLLQPDEEDFITVTYNMDEMSSYDYRYHKCYVLDDGEYEISIRSDSHNIISFDGEEQIITWENPETIIYNDENAGARLTEKESQGERSEYTAAINAFDDNLIESEMSKLNMLTRSDNFTNRPDAPTEADAIASSELIAAFQGYNVAEHNNPDAVMPKTGQDNGLGLVDMRGLDYDDPKWERLLDQLTIEEMVNLVDYGYGTQYVSSVNAPETVGGDSPQCLQSNYWSGVSGANGQLLVAYPTPTMVAMTWNQELTLELGRSYGQEALHWEMTSWYAPSINLHRSPFGGRNFEYYSEDPVVSGKTAAQMIAGAAEGGMYPLLKHFALNDQESYRAGYIYFSKPNCLYTWADEQTIRELYLKPFEICVSEAKVNINYICDDKGNWDTREIKATLGIMSSYNAIGTTWTGADFGLLTQVLRNEWGFQGYVMTDYANPVSQKYMHTYKEEMIRVGGDNMLNTVPSEWSDTESATAVINFRRAAHNILFTLAHSNAVNGILPGATVAYAWSPWVIGLMVGDTILGSLIVAGIVWCLVRTFDARKHPEKYRQREKL